MRHAVTITLRAGPDEVTTGTGAVDLLSPGRRFTRAGVVMLVAVGAAALLIPIPIIHLVGIPLALLIGVGVAIHQFRSVARLDRITLACPKCDAPNHLGGGLGYRTATGPVQTQCESCRRLLELRWRAA